MRLPLVTVVLLVVTALASLQLEEYAPAVGVDADASISGSQRTSAPRNVHATVAAEPATSHSLQVTPSLPARNGEDAASTTVDEAETMAESSGPDNAGLSWNVTGSPKEQSSSYSPEMMTVSSSLSPIQSNNFVGEETFPSASDTSQSSSSHIEVSGILISIDSVPTLGPFDKPNAESSSPRTNMVDETVFLGPVEISSILHKIISTSILQSSNDETENLNTSNIEEINSSSSLIAVKQLSNSLSYPNNDNLSQQHNTGKAARYPEMGLSSSMLAEVKKHSVYHGPLESSNPYAHWDSDSEEQEHEMELQRLHDEEDNSVTMTSGITLDAGPEHTNSMPTAGRSYLLLLAGNSTIVRLRQKDFTKYLKLNLAARLSLEYDDVQVNRVVLAPPQLLVNVSVVTPSEAAVAMDPQEESLHSDVILKEEEPLHMMAETNATLLELSGEEYHVVRLLPLHSHPSDKKLEENENNPTTTSAVIRGYRTDTELLMYTALGSAFAFGILATLFITVNRYLRISNIQWSWHRPKCLYSSWTLPSNHIRHRRIAHCPSVTASPPTVIYSGSFAARAAVASLENSWVDRYQTQSSIIPTEDMASAGGTATIGVEAMKFPATNPLYCDLEMGDEAGSIMGHYTDTPSGQKYHSPSKLHIFSCRPSSIVIPAPMLTLHHQVRRNLAENYQPLNNKAAKDCNPLDVRIRDECRLGHENPNYHT